MRTTLQLYVDFPRNDSAFAIDRIRRCVIDSPVANMTHLVFLYKVFFELFLNHFLVLIPNPIAARPKRLSGFFSKNRSIQNGRLVDDKQYCMMHITLNILYS